MLNIIILTMSKVGVEIYKIFSRAFNSILEPFLFNVCL